MPSKVIRWLKQRKWFTEDKENNKDTDFSLPRLHHPENPHLFVSLACPIIL
jgi:hypothetical protein